MEEEKINQEEEHYVNASIEKRIYKWKEKLIDLSKRNRLLNFKKTKFSTLHIIDEQPPEVYRTLVQNMQIMEFLPINISDEIIPEQQIKSFYKLNEGIEFKTQEFKKYDVKDLEEKPTRNQHIKFWMQTLRNSRLFKL